MQIELKFSLSDEQLPTLRRHRLLMQHTVSKSRAQRCGGVYYDTPDILLKAHAVALHVAHAGRIRRQTLTVNSAGTANIPPQREWTDDIRGAAPDFSAMAELFEEEPELRRCRFDDSVFTRIVPIFTIDCQRTVWQLEFEQGREAELILDTGEVHSGALHRPIGALTLLHRSGPADAFFDFALALQRDLDLRVAYLGPIDIGYAMHDPMWAGAVTAKHLVLPPAAQVGDGMRVIIRACLSHILGNAAGVSQGGELECIHQMRVGLRRLRSALAIFEPLKACPAHLQSELVWLSTELGRARDWDVLATSTIPLLAADGIEIADLAALQRRVQQEATRAHRRAARAVDSARATRLWLCLEQWLYLPGAPDADGAAGQVEQIPATLLIEFAEQNVAQFHRKMLARSASMETAVPESRHRLRIAAKKLRYATEFFLSYYRKKSTDRFLNKLADLQDIFGASNDTVVADRLLRELAQKHPDLADGCANIRNYLAEVDDKRLRRLGKRIRRFSVLKKLKLRDAAVV